MQGRNPGPFTQVCLDLKCDLLCSLGLLQVTGLRKDAEQDILSAALVTLVVELSRVVL